MTTSIKSCERPRGTPDRINARAFTVGNHIAFNHGEYDPESAEGQRVIAHELAHVRQQTGGALSMLPQEDLRLEIDPDPQLEREAEETAERVMSGGELDIQRLPLRYADVHVQRMGVPPSVGGVSDAVAGAKEKAGSVKDTVSEAASGLTDDSSNETSDSAVTMPADVEVLAEEVAQLRKDVNELQSPDSAAKKIGVEAGKGTMGAVGGGRRRNAWHCHRAWCRNRRWGRYRNRCGWCPWWDDGCRL